MDEIERKKREAIAKQSMENEYNMSPEDMVRSFKGSLSGAVDAINPLKNNVIDENNVNQPNIKVDSGELARRAKALQMLGVTPDSRAMEMQRQKNQHIDDRDQAAEGQSIMEQMNKPEEQQGFETTAQRQTRFNNLRKTMGR